MLRNRRVVERCGGYWNCGGFILEARHFWLNAYAERRAIPREELAARKSGVCAQRKRAHSRLGARIAGGDRATAERIARRAIAAPGATRPNAVKSRQALKWAPNEKTAEERRFLALGSLKRTLFLLLLGFHFFFEAFEFFHLSHHFGLLFFSFALGFF